MTLRNTRIWSLYFVSTFALSLILAGCSGDDKEAAPAPQVATPMKVIKAENRDMPYWGEFVGQINAVETDRKSVV